MGRTDAVLPCRGTTDDASDRLNMLDSGAARKGAPIFKNQAGILSEPIDVRRNVPRTSNSLHSMMWIAQSKLFAVALTV